MSNEQKLTSAIRQALKGMAAIKDFDSPLQELFLFQVTRRSGMYSNNRQVVNQMLVNAINTLAETDSIWAEILSLRFVNKLRVYEVAEKLGIAESNVYAQQRVAISRLAEIIDIQEQKVLAKMGKRLPSNMQEVSSPPLIGVESKLEQLLLAIGQTGPPWIISIEGIGGIGKTSLANALLRRVVELGVFEAVGWVSIQPTRLNMAGEILRTGKIASTPLEIVRRLVSELVPETPEVGTLTFAQLNTILQARLREVPHLIVIDNLETVDDLALFLPTLQKLVNPSKFVLTSRDSLQGKLDIFPISMSQLSLDHTLDLVRQVAKSANLPEVESADDAMLHPIYESVGGNPLALRLVVGQLHLYSLHTVIQDLRAAQGLAVENLYTFIYRRAWDRLDELSRRALLAMALLPLEGATLEFLGGITKLASSDLRSSIQELSTLSLVEVQGKLNHRMYSIHSLTRTFLLEQVAKWM